MELQASKSYDALVTTARAITAGQTHILANLANVAALLGEKIPQINWAGFYLMDGGALILGPFWGKPACVRIELGRGVCGTAAQTDSVQRIEDVHHFPGHIACDAASASELVIPLHQNGAVVGVLDLDSPIPGRFGPEDEAGLCRLAAMLEERRWTGCGYSLE